MNALRYSLAIAALCLLVCITGAAADQPLLPCEFYGTVTISGVAAPAGTVITALVDGQLHGLFTTTTAGVYGGPGNFDRRLVVSGNETDPGRTIAFLVNGDPASETAVFTTGSAARLDLHVIVVSGPPPVAGFTQNMTAGRVPLAVRFTDTSLCLDCSGRTWNFGDGATSGDRDPLHTYTSPGNYTVRLTVSNSSGSTTTEPGQTMIIYPRSDFNVNWRIDISDVTTVACMAAGLIPQDLNADFDAGGHVGVEDAARIAWYYVGKVTGL